jgi:2'-5' RNA ligase
MLRIPRWFTQGLLTMENQRAIRTFVAVCLDEELRRGISAIQERVKKLAPNVKWVAPDNFHVTLKFLGDVRQDRLSIVQAAMDEVARSLAAFDLTISGKAASSS